MDPSGSIDPPLQEPSILLTPEKLGVDSEAIETNPPSLPGRDLLERGSRSGKQVELLLTRQPLEQSRRLHRIMAGTAESPVGVTVERVALGEG